MLEKFRRSIAKFLLRALAIDGRHPGDPALLSLLRLGLDTAAGIDVDEESAFRLSTVYSCINVLSRDLAQIPFHLMKEERASRDKRKAYDHPLYRLLHTKPNSVMTAFQFRQMMQAQVLWRGNAYAEIEYGNNGRPRQLWPWPSSQVREVWDGWKVKYYFRVAGGKETPLPPERVLHVRGLSLDGKTGLSPISYMRETLGEAMAAQQFGAKFFANGATPPIILSHPKLLIDRARKNIRESFEEAYTGLNNAHRPLVLEDGMTASTLSIKPQDAQFLENRKFTRAEIAAMYNVPLHRINDLERATFSNIEQQSLEYVIYSLGPWLVNWERQIDATCLSDEEEQEGYYSKFNVDGLLRGNIDARSKAYASAIQFGWLNPNEVRDKEDLPPREGGDKYLEPANLTGNKPQEEEKEKDDGTGTQNQNG